MQYSTLSTIHSVEYSTFSSVHSVEYIQYSKFSTVHSVEYIQYKTFSRVHSVQDIQYKTFSTYSTSTLPSVHYIMIDTDLLSVQSVHQHQINYNREGECM